MPRVVSLGELSRRAEELVHSVAMTGEPLLIQEQSETLAVVAPGRGEPAALPPWHEWTEQTRPFSPPAGARAEAQVDKEVLGFDPSTGAIGSTAGRHFLAAELGRLGVPLHDERLLDETYARLLEICETKEHLYEEDLVLLAQEVIAEAPQRLRLLSMTVTCTTRMPALAEVTLELSHGPAMRREHGDGPLHAAFSAVDHLVGISPEVEGFAVVAATRGQDAIAEATIRLAHEGRAVAGRGASTDAVEAGVLAYLNALNFLLEATRGTANAPQVDA